MDVAWSVARVRDEIVTVILDHGLGHQDAEEACRLAIRELIDMGAWPPSGREPARTT
jgi:hypothetical protein